MPINSNSLLLYASYTSGSSEIQLFFSLLQQIRRYVLIVWFIRSVYPFIYEWQAVKSLRLTPISAMSIFQQFNVKSLSLSLIINRGNPLYLIYWSSSIYPRSSAEILLLHSISLVYLVNRSTSTNILLQATFITGSLNTGRPVIKSIIISIHGLSGSLIACISPYLRYIKYLLR